MEIYSSEKWIPWDGSSEGSGRSEKKWIYNRDTGEIGLFKFPKSSETKEHISEKLAQEIADLLGLKSAKVEIGIFEDRAGSFSYLINGKNETLVEGINFILRKYPTYDRDHLYYVRKNKKRYYCIGMIKESLSFEIFREFLEVMIFDCLIGNSDRHHSNWAVIKEKGKEKLSPVYDNGSSLACYVREEDIKDYLDEKQNRFYALADTKSRSRIRIDGDLKKEPTHKEVIKHLTLEYKTEMIEFVDRIVETLTEENIRKLVDNIQKELLSLPRESLSSQRKELIVKFLMAKKEMLKQLFF